MNYIGHDLDTEAYYDSFDILAASYSPIKPIYTISEFINWLPGVDIRGIVLHHTYAPTTCKGISTIKSIRNYHISIGFSDIAANFYSSDEPNILGYTARDLHRSNYAHAHVDKIWRDVSPELVKRFNYDNMYCNKYFFGLETIGNFDIQEPTTSMSMYHSILIMAAVCKKYNLNPDRDIIFHREVAYKSCPGSKVTKKWIIEEVNKEMDIKNCKDLPAHTYAQDALDWSVKNGLIFGDSEGNLMPRCNITREDFITILKRYHDKFGGK